MPMESEITSATDPTGKIQRYADLRVIAEKAIEEIIREFEKLTDAELTDVLLSRNKDDNSPDVWLYQNPYAKYNPYV